MSQKLPRTTIEKMVDCGVLESRLSARITAVHLCAPVPIDSIEVEAKSCICIWVFVAYHCVFPEPARRLLLMCLLLLLCWLLGTRFLLRLCRWLCFQPTTPRRHDALEVCSRASACLSSSLLLLLLLLFQHSHAHEPSTHISIGRKGKAMRC